MFLILSAFLFANATSSVTTAGGTAAVHTFIQTTVNGKTTTVESNQPGTVSVVKTDEGEQITAEPPVTITHSQTTIEPTPEFHKTTEASHGPALQNRNYWTSLLRSLWDRVKHMISFGILTRK